MNSCADVSSKVLALADKAVFHNCLIVMRLQAICNDLPSTHDVETYIHNQFVNWLKQLKREILVNCIEMKQHETYLKH